MKIIPLLLLLSVCVLQSSAGSHTLQYRFTEKDSKLTAEGLLDGELFIYCNSSCSSATPQGDWMEKIRTCSLKFWDRSKVKLERDLDRFTKSLKTANQDQTKGVQWIYGCELNDGTERRFWKNSSGGKDSITLELKNGDWTPEPPQRDPTQQVDKNSAAEFQKFFLMTECIDWLKEFVERKGSQKRQRRAAAAEPIAECNPEKDTGPSQGGWKVGLIVVGVVAIMFVLGLVYWKNKEKLREFKRVPGNPKASSGDDSGA